MKKNLFKYAALVLWGVLPATLYAQQNPKQGFIITNQNDTIYGLIDYLSDKKCAYECHFQPNGESGYKTYLPGDISSYRFAENGVFYVTKTFAIEGTEKTFFAEYLLEGGVSLFHHAEAGADYYFFIGEDGKVATIKDDGSYSKLALDEYTKNLIAAQKRNALGEVSQIFADSDKALHDLWTKDINSKNLTEITHDFDMEYCTSAGDCVVFRYNEKATRNISVKLLLQAGIALGSNKLHTSSKNQILKTTVPEIGIGADFGFPRLNNHLSVEVLALISRWSISDEYQYMRNESEYSTHVDLKYWDLGFQAGFSYSFMPQSKFSPVLRGGYAAEIPLYIKKSIYWPYMFDRDDDPAIHCHGFYVGAGVDISLRKHILRLIAEYRWSHSPNRDLDISRIGLCAQMRL